jgi:hypothetical protein
MAIKYRIDSDERIVYLTTEGASNYAEWKATMLSILSDPSFQSGIGFLSDRRSQTNEPDSEFARSAAQFLMQHKDDLEGCLWAAVSNDAALFGMQRMFAVLAEATGVKAMAFMDYEEARAWLLSPR